ncbi:Coiled-coil domain-containing protein 17, partial [Varanus komodoensis]
MTDLVVLHCPSCEMGFHSRRLLDKHMEKFCIGGETTTTYRNGHASHKGKEPKKTETPNKTLHAWKSKRHPFRHLEDEELKQQEHHCRSFDHTGNVPESPALKKLTEEFHKLRMSLEDTLPSFRTSQKEDGNSHQILHQKEYWQRQQQMKEAHEHQLADIQTRNQHLQQQKDEIHKRLSELKLENPATSHIEQLLMELNIQEGKNKLALDALQEQVGLLQIAAESRSNPEPPTKIKTEATEEKVQKKVAFKFMPFPAAVGPLSSEI